MKKKIVFYDTETTGTRSGKDRIIEIAALEADTECSFSTFINPECPIPMDSTAISGITDEMVAQAPLIRQALSEFFTFCPENTILIAHNNDAFDKLFLEAECQRAGLSMPRWIFIDTLKWARKYRSDLPRHSLQFLREVYGVSANQAHRALDDCRVLRQVFLRMIDDLPWETVLELLSQNQKITRMPFGKYSGKLLGDVPKDYVAWLSKSGALDKAENGPLKEQFNQLGLLT